MEARAGELVQLAQGLPHKHGCLSSPSTQVNTGMVVHAWKAALERHRQDPKGLLATPAQTGAPVRKSLSKEMDTPTIDH